MSDIGWHYWDLAGGEIQQKTWNMILTNPTQWPQAAGTAGILVNPGEGKHVVVCGITLMPRNITAAQSVKSGVLLQFGPDSDQDKIIGYYLRQCAATATMSVLDPIFVPITTPFVGGSGEKLYGIHYNPDGYALDTGLTIQYMVF